MGIEGEKCELTLLGLDPLKRLRLLNGVRAGAERNTPPASVDDFELCGTTDSKCLACDGARIEGYSHCIGHIPDDAVERVVQIANHTILIGRRATISAERLKLILQAATADEQSPRLGVWDFRGATFTGDAWFGGATFTGDAWFERATFTGDAGFRGATFTGDA